ncbi:hypothetical protein [Tumebacillus flagellatus]|uniref:Uncharacterized protein n=1 Tax=Tumebacillus flagellatus TaxID=1157490 RepID=A0A074M686_9BACL|nr:hypothetical protein [Tumebacillus flagellatus]KEO81512.1 hypothetical protein EL26_20805 [Tumebacillus flagellatus]
MSTEAEKKWYNTTIHENVDEIAAGNYTDEHGHPLTNAVAFQNLQHIAELEKAAFDAEDLITTGARFGTELAIVLLKDGYILSNDLDPERFFKVHIGEGGLSTIVSCDEKGSPIHPVVPSSEKLLSDSWFIVSAPKDTPTLEEVEQIV